MANFPLRQFGASAARMAGGAMGASVPTVGGLLLPASLVISHAMQLAGGNFTIVPAIGGAIIWPIAWQILKPTFGVVYAPTNTSFNLRIGAVATNLATSLSPQVTTVTARLDMGIGVAALNLGAGTIVNIVGQPLVLNCGAGNGAGSAANNPCVARVQYIVIRAAGLGSPFP